MEIIKATQCEDLDKIKNTINEHNYNFNDIHNMTSLDYAILYHNIDIIKFFIKCDFVKISKIQLMLIKNINNIELTKLVNIMDFTGVCNLSKETLTKLYDYELLPNIKNEIKDILFK